MTAGACTGTASVGQGSVSLLGTADGQWFKADVEAWHEISAERGDELIEAAGDKWVKDEGYEFANLCFFQNVLDSMLGTEAPSRVVRDRHRRSGRAACRAAAEHQQRNGAALASVLVDEPHYLVALQRTDDTDGAVGRTTFSEFGEQVDATAPAPNEVVDLSSFLG